MDLATLIYGKLSKPTLEEIIKLMDNTIVPPSLQNDATKLLLTSIADVIHKWYPNTIRPDDELDMDAFTILSHIQGRTIPGITEQEKQDISSAIDSYVMQLKIGLPPDNLKNILYVAIMKAIRTLKKYENNEFLINGIKERIKDLNKVVPPSPQIQPQQVDLPQIRIQPQQQLPPQIQPQIQPQSESSFWYIGLFIAILYIVIYLFTRSTYRGKRRR